jgi:hypothetical protein
LYERDVIKNAKWLYSLAKASILVQQVVIGSHCLKADIYGDQLLLSSTRVDLLRNQCVLVGVHACTTQVQL